MPSLFYASDRKGAAIVREEYEARMRHDLPVELLERGQIRKMFGIKAPCALYNEVSGQIEHLPNGHRIAHA